VEYTSRLARIWRSEDPEAQFRAACPSTLAVHAEAQLACFYDHNPERKPFRFIGVSEKSCYLYLKFLALYPGSFNVSLFHQKLYMSWTLPPTDRRETRARYKSISRHKTSNGARCQEGSRVKVRDCTRAGPRGLSARVSLTGLTEHGAENGLISNIAGPRRSMRLMKRKASATSTLPDGARLYPPSVSHMQCSIDAEFSRQSTSITQLSTRHRISGTGGSTW
jgi:hypothetical protein